MRGNDTDGILVGTRICMVVYSYYPMDQRVRREAETLKENGALVQVICLRNEDEKRADTHNDISIHRVPLRIRRKGGYFVYFLRYFMFLFLSTLALTRLFLKHKYKVVHIHSLPDYLVFCAFVPKLFGSKIILDLHELMPEIFAAKFNLSMDSKQVQIAKALERASVRYSDFTITTSQIREKKLRERIQKKDIAVIMNLPKRNIYKQKDMTDFIKENDLKDSFIVSYVGRLDPVREVDVVIKAIKHIEYKIPNIVFIFCGTGEKEYIASLKSLIADLKLEKKVLLMGYVPQEDILSYVGISHVTICPYKFYPNLEGVLDGISSTKVFEYLLIPKPVIVADFPAMKREFKDLVSFYKSGDHESLGVKIFEVYKNEAESKKIAQRAQKILFKRYDPKKNEKKLVEIYRYLLSR
ncbi:MAG: glycosyltransferase family 4 protein [Methanomassiliicoccales archaeon]|nr:MAG: glycosyltransferase family 4 protein [Methanomassiliicoccales archaeon]